VDLRPRRAGQSEVGVGTWWASACNPLMTSVRAHWAQLAFKAKELAATGRKATFAGPSCTCAERELDRAPQRLELTLVDPAGLRFWARTNGVVLSLEHCLVFLVTQCREESARHRLARSKIGE
jgi:hypothetical protein